MRADETIAWQTKYELLIIWNFTPFHGILPAYVRQNIEKGGKKPRI